MPHLSTLNSELTVRQQPAAVATAIGSISSSLPQLRSLALTSRGSLRCEQHIWNSLGTATQLTSLSVEINDQGRSSCTLRNLEPLRALSALRHLDVFDKPSTLPEQEPD